MVFASPTARGRPVRYDRAMPEDPTIRPMTVDDVEPAADVLVGGGWGDRRAFFRFAIEQPGLTPLVAEAEARIAGTGMAAVNGPVGWIGTIFVDEGLRGRGIGTALTAAVVQRLEAAGCLTLALIATPLGRPIYERLGFAAVTEYRMLVAPGGAATSTVPGTAAPEAGTATEAGTSEPVGASRLRPCELADLPAILALDVIGSGGAVVGFRAGGEIVGFDARAPWGGHPTIAPELVDGVRLVEARRARSAVGSEVRTSLLVENRSGILTLQNLGWRLDRELVRMTRGAPIQWDPRAIWGQFNYAIG
jgi:GNAT superfamily N-acetyltransferase